MYIEWGFRTNPFQTTALEPNALGRTLLVGRSEELKALKRRLTNPPRLPTLEGLNGVGKSSLVNVAAYDCFQDFLVNPDQPMLIPCRKVFQLRVDLPLEQFVDGVYREVAQTLVEAAKEIDGPRFEGSPRWAQVDKWLNSAQLSNFQAGIGGFSAGQSAETNTGDGFTKSGFPKAVRGWLEEIFPDQDSGGVVCVIDNLELLQTSDAARAQLEALRDELLLVPGLRWVLCGALGIVLGVASSPRLEGFLNGPIQVGGISEEFVSEIFDSRMHAFSDSESLYIPLLREDFSRLYSILSYNLRSLLGYADDFCQWVADGPIPQSDEEKREAFARWLSEAASKAYESAKAQLRPRAWKVFEDAIAVDGIFSPSDYEDFQFNSIPAFRPSVRDLEAAGLVVSTQDDGDKRRKTIQVTSKGWLANAHQKGQT